MWPFKKKPKVQLRKRQEDGWVWWTVWTWAPWPLGYWKYVKGSNNEKAMRELYEAHKRSEVIDGDVIIVDQSF